MLLNADRDFIIQEVTDHMDTQLADKITAGVVQAFRELAKDEEFMTAFWHQGYAQLSDNASTEVKLWIGGKIMWAFIGAAFSGAMLWLNSKGMFK